ncbi:MAG: DUF983 domain-containing protein [Flavobacteriales bacterium]
MKRTYLGSVILNKCPKCRKGDIFEKKGAFRIKGLTLTKDACEVCNADFKREPGFYFGAAYVSYALTIATWVAVFVALTTFDALGWIEYNFFDNPWTFLITGIIAVIILLPPIYRLSRSLWLSFFTKYNPSKLQHSQES